MVSIALRFSALHCTNDEEKTKVLGMASICMDMILHEKLSVERARGMLHRKDGMAQMVNGTFMACRVWRSAGSSPFLRPRPASRLLGSTFLRASASFLAAFMLSRSPLASGMTTGMREASLHSASSTCRSHKVSCHIYTDCLRESLQSLTSVGVPAGLGRPTPPLEYAQATLGS